MSNDHGYCHCDECKAGFPTRIVAVAGCGCCRTADGVDHPCPTRGCHNAQNAHPIVPCPLCGIPEGWVEPVG